MRPFLLILSAPLILLTLGLFILVLNGLLLLLYRVSLPISRRQLLECVLGRDRNQLRQLGFSAFFRWSDGRVHVLTHHNETRRVRGRVLEDEERQ